MIRSEPPVGFSPAEWDDYQIAVLANCAYRNEGACEWAERNDKPWCDVHHLLMAENTQSQWLFLRRRPPIGDAR